MGDKARLDLLLHERGLAESRSKAQAIIMAGEVTVNGVLVDKPGTRIALDATIQIKEHPPYVSRGGEKLAGALKDFEFNVTDLICADVGASTGGFTDCLLQHGAQKVYAIDVGYGQLAHKVRIDPRVVIMERTNARFIEQLDDPIQLVVIDASFISLRLLLKTIQGWMRADGHVIALIKPQFEAGKEDVRRGGVVRDRRVHFRVIEEVAFAAQELGFRAEALIVSPIKGLKEGNIEFLIWLRNRQESRSQEELTLLIEQSLSKIHYD